MLKKGFVVLMIIIFIFPLCGCYFSEGIETLAYAVAIGIDKGTLSNYKLTIQLPTFSSSSSSSNSTSQSDSSTIISVECSTLENGISLIDSYISKKVNLSHCKAVIISEELAYEGISEFLFPLVNNIEIRPTCNVIISRCDANQLLQFSKPKLESVSARYYEFIFNSSEYTAYTQDLYISDFYSDLINTSSQAVGILGGINTQSTHSSDYSTNVLDGEYKADETPIDAENHVETMGLAVFHGDTLVGELNNIETLCHLLLTNKFQNATITIPNPYNFGGNISLYLRNE